jgi:hypothetical protein
MNEYAERIEKLSRSCLGLGRTLPRWELLSALGCARPRVVSGAVWKIVEPFVPLLPGSELLVRETLKKILSMQAIDDVGDSGDDVALMDGLYRHDTWRDCVSQTDLAYCMAALCISLSSDNLPATLLGLKTHVSSQLTSILNSWLEPKVPFKEHPTAESIGRALFGDPWYEMCALNCSIHSFYLATFVCETRPAFLSTVLTDTAIALPSLEGPCS